MTERLVDKHIEEIRRLHPEAFGPAESVEEGEILPQESASSKPPEPRPTDNITGKEMVTRSSKRPLRVRPTLEETSMQLYRHRADTHTRVAHGTSNVIAHVTGFFDGVTDAAVNGAAELLEDGAFFVSKTIHGAKHGWSRGKYESSQGKNSPVKVTSSQG
jgi:hypothetical protein